jgi:glycosyltransferase involved in cell wall biosynthesis
LVHRADYRRRVAELPRNVQFIANSRATQRRLLEIGIDAARTHVHYQGVPVPANPPVRTAASETVTVLYLGRLVDFKGPQLTLMAFDSAVKQGLRGKLIMAGDGPERTGCEKILQTCFAAERIEMLGAVDEATGERLRREADLFTAHNCCGATSGQEEAYGVSIAEAMADALPVVTGRNGSLPELVDDGVQGILFEPGDVEAHAAALLRLARDPAQRLGMGQRGWERARERFTNEQASASLRKILDLPAGSAATN